MSHEIAPVKILRRAEGSDFVSEITPKLDKVLHVVEEGCGRERGDVSAEIATVKVRVRTSLSGQIASVPEAALKKRRRALDTANCPHAVLHALGLRVLPA